MVQNKSKRYEKILRNPTTIKMLALQIKQAADDYIALKISENEFTELILYYARYHHGKKMFSTIGDLNPTLLNRIGKKRAELVKIALTGFQMCMF
ncbi:TIGR04540 family protein [Caldicoprobacter algeriensis]|uniref:TIGR04540 family protein n=1 Tax=Caldicoprobacter algeriensis TaxID=699281 RepID=UPI00207988E4|nr:TIGR04540 family protein [Caldicoprobacter algeriensis]MCM8900190.1 TIGR04540 family protein [Caldicoprobacter algeriensis]